MTDKNIKMKLSGLINAVTTPFDKANAIDQGAYKEHLQWLYEKGVKNILVSGTTGEFFSLTVKEKLSLLSIAKDSFQGRIIFHAGTVSLFETKELAKSAQDTGADYVAAILPYYLSRLSETGLIKYLESISLSTELPFIIYNFPAHTQVKLTPAILSRVPHFAIKDSSGNLDLIKYTDNYFIGSDRRLLESKKNGGRGFVSARSNAEPEVYSTLDNLIKQNSINEAKKLHLEVLNICVRLSGSDQIKLIKKEISSKLKGYPVTVRLPLI